jgi:hypothetical protein
MVYRMLPCGEERQHEPDDEPGGLVPGEPVHGEQLGAGNVQPGDLVADHSPGGVVACSQPVHGAGRVVRPCAVG